MSEDALFPGYEPPPQPITDPTLSAGQRLTLRQAADIASGRHPLTKGALHPDADRDRDASSGRTDPYTCGTCVFRELWKYHNGSYPKCARDGAWASHGPATDVRAWWPGCVHYQPKET